MVPNFRAKSLANDEFVYGGFCIVHDGLGAGVPCIWEVGADRGIPIDEETLGQSTGLKDKNGTEIFEGDILNCGYWFSGSPFEELDDYEEEKGVVKFLNCGFNVKFKNDTNLFIDIMESCEDVEVIGNIYKNSELLES